MEEFVKSPLNYTGGKYKSLSQITPLFPKDINMFIDLFSGGSNVGVNVKSNMVVCNDIETGVIELMNHFKENTYEDIIEGIDALIDRYGLTRTSEYGYDYYNCNSSSGVSSINKEGYLRLRNSYNKGDRDPITFYTMLIFAFNNQIRFNKSGDFNMPVNKRDFNSNMQKNLKNFVDRLQNINIKFTEYDFRRLDIGRLSQKDFVYCDPPYLITNASYNEQGGWTESDEVDLLDLLDVLHDNNIKFALSNVLESKGKTNEILLEWSKGYTIHDLSSNYANSNYQTKNRDKDSTREVLITNY